MADLLGVNWDKIGQELSTDLSNVIGKIRGTGTDPLSRVPVGGGGGPLDRVRIGGNADPLARVNLTGDGGTLGRVSLGGYADPFSKLPTSTHDDPFWRMEPNMKPRGYTPPVPLGSGAVTGATAASGYVPGAADNSGITAQQVEAYIANGTKGAVSPLVGKGQYIIDIANKYGVSVPQMMGILQKESQFGVTAGANKNLTGIVAPTDRGRGTTRQFNGYATWEESLEATAANLATPMYKGKPLEEQIGNWYVGPNAYAAEGLNATDLAGNGTVGDYVNKFIAPAFAFFGKPLTSVSTPAGAGGDLITKARTLVGTPYQLGGYRTHRDNPRLGIDCSEYTSWIYSGTGVNLPENAQMQFNATQRIDKSQLQPGDLVFFQGTYDVGNGDYITHVGMYVGDGKMINAQTGGVMEANLNDPYWASHYAGAGRVARPAATNSAPR